MGEPVDTAGVIDNVTRTMYSFDAIIEKISGKGRLKAHATFNGHPYDGSVVNIGLTNADGSIYYIIGIR